MGLGKTYSTQYLADSNNNTGVAGQVLISTATGINWSDGTDIIGGPYLPLAGGTMTGQIIMGNAGGSYSHELKFANNTYIAGIDFQNSGELRFIDRSGGRESITFNLLNGSIEARNTGNTVTNFISTSGNSYFNGGNVGIGTTSPDFKLDVAGDVRIEGDSGLYFGDTGTSPKWGMASSGLDLLINNSTTNGDVVFLNDGNVGVGVSSPDYKLDVGGDIRARDAIRVYGNTVTTLPYNSPSEVSVNLGTYNNQYAYIDLATSHAGGSWIDFSKADGTDYGGRIRYANSSDQFQFFTNNSQKMVIDSAGKVGIGTTSPSTKLDVDGVTTSLGFRTDTANTNWSLISRDSAGNSPLYVQSANSNTNQWIARFNYGSATANGGNNVLTVGKDSSYFLNTNVGIGTTSPGTKLEVSNGSSGFAGSYNGRTASVFEGGNSAGTTISIMSPSTGYSGIFFGDENNEAEGQIQYDHSASAFRFLNGGGSERMRITSGGNVGIGNTSPDFRLHTNLNLSGSPLAYLNGTSNTFDATANLGVTHNSTAVGTGTGAGVYLANNANNDGAPSPIIAFSALSASGSYNHTYAAIYGIKTAGGADTNWVKGDLTFATGNTTGPERRMTILANGNVGIGTTNPGVKLTTASTAYNQSPTLGSGTIGGQALLDVAGNYGQYSGVSNNGDVWHQVQRNDTNVAVYNMLLNPLGGNVTMGANVIVANGLLGIGTTTLSNRLSVGGSGQNWDTSPAIKMWDSYNSKGWYVGSANNSTIGDFYIRSVTAENLYPVAADQQFTIKQSGNVGIGTISPGEKLEVEGTVYATPIAYAGNQSAYALKMGAHNNTAFDMGIKAKSTSTGGPYMSLCSANTEDVIVVQNSNVGINKANPSYNLDVVGTGYFTSTVTATNFILSSDKRLKNNIKEVSSNHIDVNWKTFEMNSDKGQSRYGVIAQELEEKHPEFVRTDDEGMKSVAYIDLLIAKIAELEARLEKAGI